MTMKKLIAALICLIMCLAMPAAYAADVTEEYIMSDIGLSISLPESWYVALRSEGAKSELAILMGYDQEKAENLFIEDQVLHAYADSTGSRAFSVAFYPGTGEPETRELTPDQYQEYLDRCSADFKNGMEVQSCEMLEAQNTKYVRTHVAVAGYQFVQYLTTIEGNTYIFLMFDNYGNAFTDSDIADLDSLVSGAEFYTPIIEESNAVADTEPGSSAGPVPSAIDGISMYHFPEIGASAAVYDRWINGSIAEGASSELAYLLGKDEEGIAEFFSTGLDTSTMHLISVSPEGGYLSLTTSGGIDGVDARDDEFDWDGLSEAFGLSYGGSTAYEYGYMRSPYANIIKLYYTELENGRSTVMYIIIFEDITYTLQYIAPNPTIDEDTMLTLEYLALNFVIE